MKTLPESRATRISDEAVMPQFRELRPCVFPE